MSTVEVHGPWFWDERRQGVVRSEAPLAVSCLTRVPGYRLHYSPLGRENLHIIKHSAGFRSNLNYLLASSTDNPHRLRRVTPQANYLHVSLDSGCCATSYRRGDPGDIWYTDASDYNCMFTIRGERGLSSTRREPNTAQACPAPMR